MFAKWPEALNAVDMGFVFTPGLKGITMVNPVMLAIAMQGIVAFKGIGIIDAAFLGFLPNNLH